MNFRTVFLGAAGLTLFSCLTAPAQVVTILQEDFNDDDPTGTQTLEGNVTNTLQVWPAGSQNGGGPERFKTGSDFGQGGTVGAGSGGVALGSDSVINNLFFGSGFSRQRAIDDGGGTFTVMVDFYRNVANEIGMELRSPGGGAMNLGWGGAGPGTGGNPNHWDIGLAPAIGKSIRLTLEIDVEPSGDSTGTYSFEGLDFPGSDTGQAFSSNDFEYDTIRIQMNGGNGLHVAGGHDNILITYEPCSVGCVQLPDRTWDNTTGGSWFVGPWINGGPPGADNLAIFGGSIESNSTVFVDSPVSVTAIRFDNGVNSYVIAGSAPVDLVPGTTLIPGDPEIEALAGTHEFQARVNLSGNTTANISSGATVEFNNRLSLNGNTLMKTGGGTLAINNKVLTAGGTVDCQQGTCIGTGTVSGNLNNSGGTVSPGNSPGVWEVTGDYVQGTDGSLLMEIGGTAAGVDHDLLKVGGNAELVGQLDVILIDKFQPSEGQVFDILDFGSASGRFDAVQLPALAEGLAWELSDLYTSGTLSVSAVPEPSSGMLMVVAIAVCFWRRRRS